MSGTRAVTGSGAAERTEPKMVTLTIEGRTAVVPEGTSIIEAAKTVGVLIPHYCYHPSLPVAGVCRMCMVQVEQMPKLAPACATSVMEGQVVHVHSDPVREARTGVLEFLLINHPLDCPVCDQAGECELQNYTFQEGRAESRYEEPKRFNPVEDFGGDVLYVPNRCILCTRCVRFMGEVAHDPVLNVSERGDRAFIGKAPGHDLTHPWAGNVVDLCPVGALLSKDFLNTARAWELDKTPSICTGCSQGCNVTVELRDSHVLRLKPRVNTDVNQFFMCDHGRMHYRWMNRTDRALEPLARIDGTHAPVSWDDALASANALIGSHRVIVVSSPNASNEALHMAAQLRDASQGRGFMRVMHGDTAPLPGAPDLSLRAERAANATGARLQGFTEAVEADWHDVTGTDVVLLLDDPVDGDEITPEASLAMRDALARARSVIAVTSVLSPFVVANANVVLPAANAIEHEGTVTNVQGRVQRYQQARPAPGTTRAPWLIMAQLLSARTEYAVPQQAAQLFTELASTHPAFRAMSYRTLGLRGALVSEPGRIRLPVLEEASA